MRMSAFALRSAALMFAPFALLSLTTPACGPADPAPGGNGGSGGASASGGATQNASGGAGGSNAGGSGAGGSASGSGGATGSGGSTGNTVALPVIVTTHFNNQGWFGDAEVSKEFKPGTTIIKQGSASTGLCAMRSATPRGQCIKVEYKPPANLMVPTEGGFVGVFFLTTLTKPHPELKPPAAAGEANWGAEPGKKIAPGAQKVTFSAAAETDGATVIFKAGTDADAVKIPETPQTLTTAWKTYELPLDGQTYAEGVLGGFAWVIKDTKTPVTFYLDNIVWE